MGPLILEILNIKKIIDTLRKSINRGVIQSSFNTGKGMEKINLFEIAFGVELPVSYKTFLAEINGGFIADEEANWHWQNGEYDQCEQMCFKLLSIDEIIEEYEYMMLDNWKLKPGFEGFYPYIPFCKTPNNEKLIFVDNFKQGTESKVYAAFHDSPASDWFIVSNNFTEFITEYINTEGKPNLYKKDNELYAEDYLYILNGRAKEINNPEEIIKRSTAYLKLYPDSAITYATRANAYNDKFEYEKALADYNRSIELDEKYALSYYCRGSMLLHLDKARQALTDLDSACQLEPDDPFYLSGRAEAFYVLNRMDEALADCNRAIEIDEHYFVAYTTRHKIYLYLGEGDKAEADAEKIDELLSAEN